MSQTYLLYEALLNFSFTKFINIKFLHNPQICSRSCLCDAQISLKVITWAPQCTNWLRWEREGKQVGQNGPPCSSLLSVFPAPGAQQASSLAFSAFSTWVSELAEDVRGDGRVWIVEQKQAAEQKQGVVVQQSRSTRRGSNRLCSSRWNTNCHIRSYRWKRRMTAASSNSHHWYNSKAGPWWFCLASSAVSLLVTFAFSAGSPSAIEGRQHAVTNSARKGSWRPPWLGAAAALWRVLSQRCIIPKGKAGE